jgi:hypothetical protein
MTFPTPVAMTVTERDVRCSRGVQYPPLCADDLRFGLKVIAHRMADLCRAQALSRRTGSVLAGARACLPRRARLLLAVRDREDALHMYSLFVTFIVRTLIDARDRFGSGSVLLAFL